MRMNARNVLRSLLCKIFMLSTLLSSLNRQCPVDKVHEIDLVKVILKRMLMDHIVPQHLLYETVLLLNL